MPRTVHENRLQEAAAPRPQPPARSDGRSPTCPAPFKGVARLHGRQRKPFLILDKQFWKLPELWLRIYSGAPIWLLSMSNAGIFLMCRIPDFYSTQRFPGFCDSKPWSPCRHMLIIVHALLFIKCFPFHGHSPSTPAFLLNMFSKKIMPQQRRTTEAQTLEAGFLDSNPASGIH